MRKSLHLLVVIVLLTAQVAGAGVFCTKVENPLPGVHSTLGMPDVLGVAAERPDVSRYDDLVVVRHEPSLGTIHIFSVADARLRTARIAHRPAFHPRRPPPRSLMSDSAPAA